MAKTEAGNFFLFFCVRSFVRFFRCSPIIFFFVFFCALPSIGSNLLYLGVNSKKESVPLLFFFFFLKRERKVVVSGPLRRWQTYRMDC